MASAADTARKLLLDEDTTASACARALEVLYPGVWRFWEPETLWLDLGREGCDVPVSNRQQAMAARAVLNHDRVYYDALVFDKVAAAFSNEDIHIDSLEEAPVAYMAWAVDEIAWLTSSFEMDSDEYDREVVEYVATQLHSEGFVVAPYELRFAQKALDRRHGSAGEELKQRVSRGWTALDGPDLREHAYPETPEGVQLARLASVTLYVRARRAARASQLARI